MTGERWRKIEEIYHAALERDPAQRCTFLNEGCAGDEEFRREIELLLAAHSEAGSFLGPEQLTPHIRELVAGERTLAAGDTFSHYKVVSSIGSGGMGEVYLARDVALDRPVALKILSSRLAESRQWQRRFEREARAISTLNHPNILTIHEIGQANGMQFLATEFVEGETLRDRLKLGRIEWKQLLPIGVQCAAALEAAHKAGIIHRDVKPENIMIRPDGLVKVLDFGLARVEELRDTGFATGARTETGVLIGTPRYMSPEQARGLTLDARTDIFSLGLVLYEMAAGHSPFGGATSAEVFAALLDKPAQPLYEVAVDLPAELDRIIGKALAKDPGRRYQSAKELCADLERLERQSRAGVEVRRARRPWRMRVPLMTAGAMILVTAVVFGIVAWSGGSIPPPRTIPLTSFPGSKDQATFSPDGARIAFIWDGNLPERDGQRNVYVEAVGSGAPTRLTSASESERFPAWSPDGRQLGFSRRLADGETLFVIASSGGPERRIGPCGTGLSWSPDGKSLAFLVPSGKGQDNLVVYALATGAQRLITSPAPASDALPAFSPDGKRIAFVRSLTLSAREVFVVPTAGGAARRLTFDNRPIWGVTWTADGRSLIFSSNRGGGQGLWRIPASGGKPERINVTSQSAFYPNISRRGDRLAYTEEFNDTNILSYQGAGFMKHASPQRFASPTCLLCSTREDHSQQFSPDGKKIVFASNRTGSDEIWVANRDGSQLVQLTNFDGPATGTPRWSFDGRWIAFDSRAAGSADIYVVAAEGGKPRRVTTELSTDSMPSWSHDGRWIYFNSNREDGGQIWKVPAGGGPAVRVTRLGAHEAMEAPDGQTLYYTKHNAVFGIWSVPVDGGAETPVPELSNAGYWRSWGMMDQGLYFFSKDSADFTIRFFSFPTHRTETIATVEKIPLSGQPGLAISPDGRSLLFAQLDHKVNDLMMIENFR